MQDFYFGFFSECCLTTTTRFLIIFRFVANFSPLRHKKLTDTNNRAATYLKKRLGVFLVDRPLEFSEYPTGERFKENG